MQQEYGLLTISVSLGSNHSYKQANLHLVRPLTAVGIILGKRLATGSQNVRALHFLRFPKALQPASLPLLLFVFYPFIMVIELLASIIR